MHHIESPSSNIKSYAFNPVDERLEIRFKCGSCKGTGSHYNKATGEHERHACEACRGSGHTGTYSYANVPVGIYDQFRNSESHGRAFSALIKSKYPHTKS